MKKILDCNSSGAQSVRFEVPSNPGGKLDIQVQTAFATHRYGWDYALESLLPEYNDKGIHFEGFLDHVFNETWESKFGLQTPFEIPWTGFFHNPPVMPSWFPKECRIDRMIQSEEFQKSLPHCAGLFTLSEYLANYLRDALGVKVSSLIYPSEIPEKLFNYERFLENSQKKVVAIGWWLRRVLSISYLPLDNTSPYQKCQLGNMTKAINDAVRGMGRLEFVRDIGSREKLEDRFKTNTEVIPYLDNDAYDDLLTENLVFLDLVDSSANTVIVECIARGTPLLVNPIPAVREYLGDGYPFYFDSLEEAANKACDWDLVRETHDYLMNCTTRSHLGGDQFLKNFRACEVYSNL